MVADALEIADGVEQGVHALAVGVAQLPAGQLDQIGAEGIFVLVYLGLFVPDFLGQGVVPLVGQAHGLHHAHAGQLGHIRSGCAGALHSNGGRLEQTLIQQGEALFLGIVRDGEDGQLFQNVGERQQDRRGRNVEHRVDDSDAPRRDGIVDKGEVQDQIQAIVHCQKEGHTDDVEVQMHHGGAAGVFVGTHRGDQRGDAGADVLAHDDGDGAAVGDDAGGAERLQDADAGAGALDDAGDECTDQNTQQRVGEADEEVGEPDFILQRGDRIGHGGHAGHQNGKADEDGADALPLFALAHVEQDADEGQQGAERGGLEQLDEEAVALQAGKAQDPAGDGGAHVAAHDDADGLVQLHDACFSRALPMMSMPNRNRARPPRSEKTLKIVICAFLTFN